MELADRRAIGQSQLPAAELAAVLSDVLTVLSTVVDPRARHGVRHGCGAVLCIAVCAVLAGARSYPGDRRVDQDLTYATTDLTGQQTSAAVLADALRAY